MLFYFSQWPGNLFSAKSIVILARLFVDDIDEGIHWFRIDLFEGDNRLRGYEIKDIGAKGGYNGVENGCITFHDMHVPVASLLCKWAQIHEDGSYTSEIAKEKRFTECLKVS